MSTNEQHNGISVPLDAPSPPDAGRPQDVFHWFVLRVTYGRERKLATILEESNIKYYLPTVVRHYNRPKDGKLMKKEISAIPNLLFVYITRAHLQALKREMEDCIPFRYLMDKATRQPAIVRERQMDDFIKVTSMDPESLLYLDNPDVVLRKGEPVEITHGPLAGVQAYVLRIHRDRKVVLSLDGIIAAAYSVHIPQEWLRKIPKSETKNK